MKIWHTLLGAIAIGTLAACGGSSDIWSLSVSEVSKTLARPGSAIQTSDVYTLTGGDSSPAKADGSACAGGQYGFATSPCQVAVMSTDGTVRGTVSFDWTYATKDTSGPGADLFGVVVDGTTMYVGVATVGTAPSDSHWQIKRVVTGADGSVTVTWADGNDFFDNVLDDCATLVYS